MSNMTHEHVQHLARRGKSLMKRLENLKEKLSGTTARAVRTLEVSTGAVIGGVIQGHAGPEGAKIMHVPVDLGLGLLLNLAGYFDAAGDEYSPHLNNFGDGFLASYLSNVGFHAGNKWRTEGSLTAMFKPATKTPELAATTASGSAPSPEQMAQIIENVRANGG